MEHRDSERQHKHPRPVTARLAASSAARQEERRAAHQEERQEERRAAKIPPAGERQITDDAPANVRAEEKAPRANPKRAHYRRIGAMGGATVRDRHGPAYYAKIGQIGGEVTKRTMSQEHFREIGQLGGRIAALRRRAKRWRDDQEEWRDLDTLASRDGWDDWFE